MGAQYMLKTNIDHLEGLTGKFVRNLFTCTVALMSNTRLKGKKNSSHHRSEVFYLLGLNQLVFTLTQQHSQGKL